MQLQDEAGSVAAADQKHAITITHTIRAISYVCRRPIQLLVMHVRLQSEASKRICIIEKSSQKKKIDQPHKRTERHHGSFDTASTPTPYAASRPRPHPHGRQTSDQITPPATSTANDLLKQICHERGTSVSDNGKTSYIEKIDAAGRAVQHAKERRKEKKKL